MSVQQVPELSVAQLGPGSRLGPYELICAVAQGGMARVWAARHHPSGQIVAVKTIRPELASSTMYCSLFVDEARYASQVTHENVCQVYGLGDERGVLYIAMEWVHGESLARLLKPNKGDKPRPLPPRIAARLVADGCRALHAAHELRDENGRHVKLVHCDVSPQNLLLTTAGTLKLVDFGVAQSATVQQQPAEGPQSRPSGKAAYMAPEQATGARISRMSDVFVLGVCLYELSTGKRPFATGSWDGTIERLKEHDFAPPCDVVEDYPPLLERIVLRAMARGSAFRYPSAQRMGAAIEDWLRRSGPPVAADDLKALLEERAGDIIRAREAEIAGRG
jgi:serine/threonine protein kinase